MLFFLVLILYGTWPWYFLFNFRWNLLLWTFRISVFLGKGFLLHRYPLSVILCIILKCNSLLSLVSWFYSLLYFGLDLVCSFILVMPFLCNFDSTYRSRLLRILWSLLGKVFSHLLLGHLPAGCPQKPAACLSFMLVLPGRLLEFHQLQSPQALLPKASETIGSV